MLGGATPKNEHGGLILNNTKGVPKKNNNKYILLQISQTERIKDQFYFETKKRSGSGLTEGHSSGKGIRREKVAPCPSVL